MCRICGRIVKCFFENMPSRSSQIHHVPSRRFVVQYTTSPNLTMNRAFTTLRRLPSNSSNPMLIKPTPRRTQLNPQTQALINSPSSLIKSFSSLTLTNHRRPTLLSTSSLKPTPNSTSTLPTAPSISLRTPSLLQSPSLNTYRAFSTSPISLGSRRRMDTFSPSRRVQKRRHGYLARLRTRSGRAILKRRMLKGRKYLSW